jgi:septal ring factor EnvC (AmiA/AmiB activator)
VSLPIQTDPADRDTIQTRLRARDASLADLAARLDAAERARDDLRRATQRQATEIVQLTARVLGPDSDRAELQVRVEILEAELAAIRNSPAWRLTLPLRWLMAWQGLVLRRVVRWWTRASGPSA